MRLYLVQHGEAKSKEEDPSRSLSSAGKEAVEKVGEFLARSSVVKIKQIIHSGKERAKQTAEILERFLKPEEGINKASGLDPLEDPSIWKNKLKDMEDDIMLVGHMPHLGRLSAVLICGDENKKIIDFQMGGVVCLKKEEESFSVDWILVPKLL